MPTTSRRTTKREDLTTPNTITPSCSSTTPPPAVDFAASGQGEKGDLMGIIATIYLCYIVIAGKRSSMAPVALRKNERKLRIYMYCSFSKLNST